MHVGQIFRIDYANGPGMRVTVFVSGCTLHCAGCFQPQTWDDSFGQEYTPEMEDGIIEELAKPYYTGLSISGGEPFEIANQKAIIGLIRKVKKERPDRTIWMYTGFTYDKDLVPGGKQYCEVTDEILDNIDVLVDGPFVKGQETEAPNFKGSKNQRIIDMKKTRSEGKIVLDPLNDAKILKPNE